MFVKRVLKASAISPGEMKACFPVFTSDNQTADTPFPPHSDKLALANDTGSLFIKKISDLRVSLDTTENLCSTVNRHSSHCSLSFTAFRRVDMDSLRKP